MIWECPSCQTHFIGATESECFTHLLDCGSPDRDYQGYVYFGVKGCYRDEIDSLRNASGVVEEYRR